MDDPAHFVFSDSQFMATRVDRELPPNEALNAVRLRLKHAVDETPKRNVIFEVDSDISEDVLVKVVEKLSFKFAQIDVITHDEEHLPPLVERLSKDLSATIVAKRKDSTDMKGTRSEPNKPQHAYSLTVGTLSYSVQADFGRDVREEREQNRVAVLYRTENLLVGRGMLEPQPLDTVELHITSLLSHIYRLVDLLDDGAVLHRLREFIKRYSDRFVFRLLQAIIWKLTRSARAAKTLVQGTHYGLVTVDGVNSIVVNSATEREHLGIRQFLQLHHSLPMTPLRLTTVQRSPLHLLKAYSRVMGVFRRGGYELRQWLPFLTQLRIYPSRVYPNKAPVSPIYSMPPSVTISDWIVHVETLMGFDRKIRQDGVRIIVCPSTTALHQLFRYLKYSLNDIVSLTVTKICTGPVEQLEQLMINRSGQSMTAVLTTAAHFDTWHTRYMSNMPAITVILGTPSNDLRHLHQAYRFARPVTNVITVPFERSADRTPSSDSGFDSDSSASCEEQQTLCAMAFSQVANRSKWAEIFMKEMWGKGDWQAPLSCPDDAKYERCVQWMRKKWKKEASDVNDFNEWVGNKMEEYRETAMN